MPVCSTIKFPFYKLYLFYHLISQLFPAFLWTTTSGGTIRMTAADNFLIYLKVIMLSHKLSSCFLYPSINLYQFHFKPKAYRTHRMWQMEITARVKVILQYHNSTVMLPGNQWQAERSRRLDKGLGGLERWIWGGTFEERALSFLTSAGNEHEIRADIGDRTEQGKYCWEMSSIVP